MGLSFPLVGQLWFRGPSEYGRFSTYTHLEEFDRPVAHTIFDQLDSFARLGLDDPLEKFTIVSPNMQTIPAFLVPNEDQRFNATFEIVLIDQFYFLSCHCVYPHMVVVERNSYKFGERSVLDYVGRGKLDVVGLGCGADGLLFAQLASHHLVVLQIPTYEGSHELSALVHSSSFHDPPLYPDFLAGSLLGDIFDSERRHLNQRVISKSSDINGEIRLRQPQIISLHHFVIAAIMMKSHSFSTCVG